MEEVKTFAKQIALAATVSTMLAVGIAIDAGVASAHAGSGNGGWSATKQLRGHTVSHRHVANGTLCRVDGKQFRLVSLNARNGDCVG